MVGAGLNVSFPKNEAKKRFTLDEKFEWIKTSLRKNEKSNLTFVILLIGISVAIQSGGCFMICLAALLMTVLHYASLTSALLKRDRSSYEMLKMNLPTHSVLFENIWMGFIFTLWGVGAYLEKKSYLIAAVFVFLLLCFYGIMFYGIFHVKISDQMRNKYRYKLPGWFFKLPLIFTVGSD